MADAIRKGMLVTISLVMADMTGRTLEETPPEGMVYLHGEGDIFPRLEKALEGHFAGEGFTIHLEPEEAFGEYDADAIRCIPVENFAHPERLEVGELVDEVPGEAPDGRSWRVTDMADGMAVLEANHPLSGVGLQFAVKVLDVHEPSEAELESMEAMVPLRSFRHSCGLPTRSFRRRTMTIRLMRLPTGSRRTPTATDRPWLNSPSRLASCVKAPEFAARRSTIEQKRRGGSAGSFAGRNTPVI